MREEANERVKSGREKRRVVLVLIWRCERAVGDEGVAVEASGYPEVGLGSAAAAATAAAAVLDKINTAATPS